MGRGKAYSEAQLLVIKAETKAGNGYREILKKRPGLGFTKRGLENATKKIKAGGSSQEGRRRREENETD